MTNRGNTWKNTRKTNIHRINDKMATKLQKKYKFIQDLNKLSTKEKLEYLNKCPDDFIDILCEGCFNLMKNPHLKNKRKVKEKLKPVRLKVKHLTDRNTEIDLRRQILRDKKLLVKTTGGG